MDVFAEDKEANWETPNKTFKEKVVKMEVDSVEGHSGWKVFWEGNSDFPRPVKKLFDKTTP